MASAAAVSADTDRPPIENDFDETNGVTSTVTADQPDEVEDDEDDDIQRKGRRQERATNNLEDDDEDEDGMGGLFGDDDEQEELPEDPAAEPQRRELDDAELDSGDDEGRLDRVGDGEAEEEPEMQEQEKIVMDLDLPRQAGPEPSDGEMYVLKVPSFMAFQPKAWKPADFQPPTVDHHRKAPSTTFSPYNTAMTTLRWRRSPNNPSELQSNARILRWSDGSLTVQLASDPTTQYEMPGNPLAPPQRNPIKPTPTSTSTTQKGGRQGASTAQGGSAMAEKYNPDKDTLTYLIAPYPAVGTLRVSHKLTAGLTVKQSASVVDDAITQLQSSLAAASNASRVQGTSGDLIQVDEDPDLARRQAELAEREKARARKRRAAQEERDSERSGRTLGRHGLGSGRGGGLNASMLEDDEELGFASQGRAGKGGAKAKKPRQRRANSEYSSDEDYGRKGFQSKADEYDEEDDFVAGSDEEEVIEDDEDEDDGIREGSPKRSRGGDDEEEDAQGEDDDDDDAAVQATRKRRKVVLDDEEED